MRRVFVHLFSVFLVVLLACGGVFLWGYAQYTQPGPLKSPATVVIPKGSGLAEIAQKLASAHVISRADVFRLAARITRADTTLKAGEYAFAPAITMRGAVALLQSGKTVVRRLTVVEGLTSGEIVKQLDTVDGLEGTVSRIPPEGALLPETYHFSYGDSRAEIVHRMEEAMTKTVADLWADRAEGLPYDTPEQAVVVASLVEKETGVAAERARVAAVFLNRLKKGMRLQSDPTVAYALAGEAGPLGRPLTHDDLKTPSPYNTYLHRGLPPGPICNPGQASLYAAMHPADTNELYFVADGSGGHVFARTLEEHNRNVAKWRTLQKNGLEPAGGSTP